MLAPDLQQLHSIKYSHLIKASQATPKTVASFRVFLHSARLTAQKKEREPNIQLDNTCFVNIVLKGWVVL